MPQPIKEAPATAKITVFLEWELNRKIRIHCIDNRKSLQSLFAEALSKYLEEGEAA